MSLGGAVWLAKREALTRSITRGLSPRERRKAEVYQNTPRREAKMLAVLVPVLTSAGMAYE